MSLIQKFENVTVLHSVIHFIIKNMFVIALEVDSPGFVILGWDNYFIKFVISLVSSFHVHFFYYNRVNILIKRNYSVWYCDSISQSLCSHPLF